MTDLQLPAHCNWYYISSKMSLKGATMREFNFLIACSLLAEGTAAAAFLYGAIDLSSYNLRYPLTVPIYINIVTSFFLSVTALLGFLALLKKSKYLSLWTSLFAIISFVVALMDMIIFGALFYKKLTQSEIIFDEWFSWSAIVILPTPTYIFYRFWEFLKFNYDEDEDVFRESSLSSDLIHSMSGRRSVNLDSNNFRSTFSENPNDVEVNQKF